MYTQSPKATCLLVVVNAEFAWVALPQACHDRDRIQALCAAGICGTVVC
jgi:hypothetical protein